MECSFIGTPKRDIQSQSFRRSQLLSFGSGSGTIWSSAEVFTSCKDVTVSGTGMRQQLHHFSRNGSKGDPTLYHTLQHLDFHYHGVLNIPLCYVVTLPLSAKYVAINICSDLRLVLGDWHLSVSEMVGCLHFGGLSLGVVFRCLWFCPVNYVQIWSKKLALAM